MKVYQIRLRHQNQNSRTVLAKTLQAVMSVKERILVGYPALIKVKVSLRKLVYQRN